MNGVTKVLQAVRALERAELDAVYFRSGVLSAEEAFGYMRGKRTRDWHDAKILCGDHELEWSSLARATLAKTPGALTGGVHAYVRGEGVVRCRVIVPLTRRGQIRAAARKRKLTRGWK